MPCSGLPDPLRRRARHVLSENARVDAMVAALAAGDLPEAGRLLDASHASLRDDYDASVPAVEAVVARLKAAGAAGARMVGGGFGGSVLALLPPGSRAAAGLSRGRSGAAGASSLTPPGAAASRSPSGCSSPTISSPSGRANAHSEEDRRGDQHRHADPQVEVPAGRLVDLGVRGAEPEDEEDHAVDQEQPADDAAQVEQVRRAARALGVDLGLLVLRDEGVPVGLASDMVWSSG